MNLNTMMIPSILGVYSMTLVCGFVRRAVMLKPDRSRRFDRSGCRPETQAAHSDGYSRTVKAQPRKNEHGSKGREDKGKTHETAHHFFLLG